MATDTNFGSENPNKRNNYLTILLIIIALLAGANIYLWVKLNQKSKEVAQSEERTSVDSMRIVDLDAKYNQALTEIQSMKGQNAKLDSILSEKEAEIKKMRADLESARKSRRISDADYNKQVAGLQRLVDDLKAQITLLEQEKGILVTQKDSLGRALSVSLDESGRLREQNKTLGRKATLGSLLKPQNMEATGVFGKGRKEKEKETTNAKKTERIRVCFDVDENKVADPGNKTFLVRIISPEGVTLAVQSQGSGIFDVSETGEQMQYTTKAEIDYRQAKQNVCAYWTGAAGGFAKGKYTAEVYQEGFKIGTKEFTLK